MKARRGSHACLQYTTAYVPHNRLFEPHAICRRRLTTSAITRRQHHSLAACTRNEVGGPHGIVYSGMHVESAEMYEHWYYRSSREV